MELVMLSNETKIITLAYVTDEDAKVLEAVGYEHWNEQDFVVNNKYLEVWKPKNN